MDHTDSELSGVIDTFGPIPYYPALKKLVPNVTCAILVAYLEMRFPAPQDSTTRIASLPVEVDLDTVAGELQVSRRTLGIGLYAISRVFKDEDRRLGSARVAREFLLPNHQRYGKHKLYSIVSRVYLPKARAIRIRRNLALFASSFPRLCVPITSGDIQSDSQDIQRKHQDICDRQSERQLPDVKERGAIKGQATTLASVLLRGSELASDRRKTRYERVRRVKQKSLAVEPELPEDVRGRLVKDELGDTGGRGEG